MKHKKLERIDYVAPQVIDLGFPDSLYGQEVICSLQGSSAVESCAVGPSAKGSCHNNGNGAGSACERSGLSAGMNCVAQGSNAKIK